MLGDSWGFVSGRQMHKHLSKQTWSPSERFERELRITGMHTNRFGLTMLEIIVSLAIVSTLLLVSLSASASLLKNQNQADESLRARELGGTLLDEISAMSMRDLGEPDSFGLETGENTSTRVAYDDVDDYHNYSATPPVFRDGNAIPGYDGWTISAITVPASYSSTGVTIETDTSAPFRVVTVNCTAPSGASVSQTVLVSDVPRDLDASVSYDKVRRVRFAFSAQRVLDVVVPLRNAPPPSY